MSFKRITTGDQNLELIQSNIQAVVNTLEASPFQGGNLLTGVVLAAGSDNQVSHKLGRTPAAWTLLDQTSQSTVWRASWDENFLTLRCSATCTVNVWVK